MKSVFAKWALILALLGGVSFAWWQLTQATVSTTAPRNDYIGNDATATYSYTFRIFASSDLRVTTRTAAGVETPLVLTTNYTVTGVNNASGGTITLVAGNLTSGTALTIRSDRTPQQSTDLRNQGSFFAETHETKFDELTRYAQQLRDVVARSLHLPETEVGTDLLTTLPTATLRASKFLAFDSSGNTIVAAGTSASLGPVSGYINTLLDDVDSLDARTTLGASEIEPTDLGFRIRGSASQSKKLAFEVDGLTAATTRTVTIPDRNVTLGTTLATEQATSSGTSINFTGIPAGVHRVSIMLAGVSTTGTSAIVVQIGDSGGIETSGYDTSYALITNAVSPATSTSPYHWVIVSVPAAAGLYSGTIELTREESTGGRWIGAGNIARTDISQIHLATGQKPLSAELDRVRITTSVGTDTFDAGLANISYQW